MRWEFYVQLFVIQLSQALVNNPFRVLFSELMPVGNEVRWFGLQVVISCATVCMSQLIRYEELRKLRIRHTTSRYVLTALLPGLDQLCCKRTPTERHASAQIPTYSQPSIPDSRAPS